jgi:7-cyano-7-deazaguanine synthase
MSMHTILLLSGGLDSTTLLYELLHRQENVAPIGFDYGQRHRRELDAAHDVCARFGFPYVVYRMPNVQSVKPPIPDGHYADESMKATVWPNRNMVMLSIAAAVAVDMGFNGVAYAAHGGDHTIYPDCRPEFVNLMREAILAGNWHKVVLEAPFINRTKAQIVKRGAQLGVPFHLTWSCYRGGDVHCGTCGTCTERREAFQLAGVPDPTVYAR